jgi:sigma-B regulation protein RsbU (phosphoserine phosphatase)
MSEPQTVSVPAAAAAIGALEAPVLRQDLRERRRRLERARAVRDGHELVELLAEVDAALERLESGHYGVCTVCRGAVEHERLAADPLVHVCLECLTPQQTRALEHDLETAARVQGSLLPPRELFAAGWEAHYDYRPHGPVSGDYVDLIPPRRPDGPLWVLFGDVSGKGVAASILMASLHALFRSLVAAELPLPELLRQANRFFCESTPAAAYATLVAGRLGPQGEIELASAGHPQPLLVRPGGVETVPVSGLPLGLFCGAEFQSARIQLAPEDLLFLYTDGLSEAVDGSGQAYPAERLAALLGAVRPGGAAELNRQALADHAAFRGDAPMHDDLTVMALRRATA